MESVHTYIECFVLDLCSPGNHNCLHTAGCTVDKDNISTFFCENGFEIDTDSWRCKGNGREY